MHIGAGFPLYKKAPSDEGALSFMPRMKSVFVIAMIFLFSEGIPPAVPIDDFAIIDDE